jgi:hypothetical protein
MLRSSGFVPNQYVLLVCSCLVLSSMMRFFHCCLELLWNRNSGKHSTTLLMFELINEGNVMLQAIAGMVQYM